MSAVLSLRQWVKARQHPSADLAYRIAFGMRRFSIPTLPVVHRALYAMHIGVRNLFQLLSRVFWHTPLFQSRLSRPAPGLFLYGGMPLVLGPVQMSFGADCRVSGQTTISGRTSGADLPHLAVGKNCDIGWQTTIAVGRKVQIGDNVRIAGRALLAGYPGHPVDALARARGDADTQDQIGDIVLESDVWLATGVTVLAGVRIGRGTIVGAGSVVTHDLPSGVLAAGVPARVLRTIEAH
jgi:acetyltransferase-like isoleucine patch superfamily enzyme